MATGSQIAFSQVTQTTPPAGQAMLGVAGQVVTVGNGENTNIVLWTFTVNDVPPGSAVPTGVVQTGATSTWTYTPDLPDCYSITLVTEDTNGNLYSDTRAFGVPRAGGLIIPPFAGDAASLNFGGTLLGWDPIMRAWLLKILASGSGLAGAVVVNGGTTASVAPTSAFYVADNTHGNGIATAVLSPGTFDGEQHLFEIGKGQGTFVVPSFAGVSNMVDPNTNANVNTFTLSGLGSSKLFVWCAALSLWL